MLLLSCVKQNQVLLGLICPPPPKPPPSSSVWPIYLSVDVVICSGKHSLCLLASAVEDPVVEGGGVDVGGGGGGRVKGSGACDPSL